MPYDRRYELEKELEEIDAEDRAWENLERRQSKLIKNGNPQGLCADCAGDGEYPNGQRCTACKGSGTER